MWNYIHFTLLPFTLLADIQSIIANSIKMELDIRFTFTWILVETLIKNITPVTADIAIIQRQFFKISFFHTYLLYFKARIIKKVFFSWYITKITWFITIIIMANCKKIASISFRIIFFYIVYRCLRQYVHHNEILPYDQRYVRFFSLNCLSK